jgi:hypothetical protein
MQRPLSRPASSVHPQPPVSPSPTFFSTLRASPDPISARAASRRLISIPATQTHPRRSRAHEEKKAILDWLSVENPPPGEVLRRLSNSSTPFASLLSLACDELEHALGPVRSEKLDELERDSSLAAARLEVEIQREHDRTVKLRHEAAALRDDLQYRKRDLDRINMDIDRLHRLHEQYGIQTVKEKPKAEEDWSQYRELGQPVVKLDDELYRTLWTDQQQIHTEIQALETECQAKQQAQLGEMRKYILRRYPQLATLK